VFRLPAASDVGGEIPFRLRLLNSVWILVPAVKAKGPSCSNACVGSAPQGFCWGFNLLHGWACITSFRVTEFENTMRVFAVVCFVCVLDFHRPICVSLDVVKGQVTVFS
jgi:hypothetical protein